MEEDFERELKVVVVGNGGVGKTSMIRRFCKGIYTEEYKKTIGVDFLEKIQYIESLGEDFRMMVWDTAGQEEYDSITRTYYRGAGAAVLAFSTTDRPSFEAVEAWKGKVQAECGDIAMAIVQNKVDLIDKAVVTPEEAEALARRLGLKFYRSCVKENLNVLEVFVYLAQLYNKKLSKGVIQSGPAATPIVASAVSDPSIQQQTHEEIVAATPKAEPAVVDLKPSKQRTGGKKSFPQRLKSPCSIL